jgi:hypothetical protein
VTERYAEFCPWYNKERAALQSALSVQIIRHSARPGLATAATSADFLPHLEHPQAGARVTIEADATIVRSVRGIERAVKFPD